MVEFEGQQPIDLDLLERLRSIFESYQEDVYLVGGAVRDLFLHRQINDLDFTVTKKAIRLTFLVADTLGYPAYILDQERDAGRVILADKGITIDFAAFRKDTLVEDLRLRDFTINAMALPSLEFDKNHIIDPYGGLEDLALNIIRPTSDEVISSDPLRALRAVRFSAELDFSLSQEVEELIKSHRLLLRDVSGERIRDELVRIVNSPRPVEGLESLGTLGLYPFFSLGNEPSVEVEGWAHPEHDGVFRAANLFPSVKKVDSWLLGEDGLEGERLRLAAEVIQPIKQELVHYFDREVEGGLNGWTILKLGALFTSINHAFDHDLTRIHQASKVDGKKNQDPVSNFVRGQLKVLRLSRAAQQQILAIIIGSHRPLQTAIDHLNSRRDIYKYYRGNQPAGVDIAWLSIASALAEKLDVTNPLFFSKLISTVGTLLFSYFRHYDEIIKPVPVIKGTELIKELNLEPGPDIGHILDQIVEGQAAGDIENQGEALNLARHYLRNIR